MCVGCFFFFKQKTAYELRISDWSSDVCSSDLIDDRIRENLRKYRQMDIRDLIDLSVNETLPRTVMTTLSMVLALGSLLLLGGEVIRGFTAAMLLGIVVGTYSSIYVSSSLLISLGVGPHTFVPKDSRSEEHTSELQSLM